MLSFPQLPLDGQDLSFSLTGTQVQGYVTQQLCPSWARFQQLDYHIKPHPRFYGIEQEIRSRQQQGIAFKKQVIEALHNIGRVCFETAEYTWQQAIRTNLDSEKHR